MSIETVPNNLRAIDQQAFSDLTEPHRRALQAHCYRMVGSPAEAEELAQETLWRAWRRRETYEGRAPLRAWLYKIATNLCLDALKQRPRRTLPVALDTASTVDQPAPPPATEPVWLEPFPDDLLAPDEANPEARYSLHESVALAFMTSLQVLPPRQRAVLILRDVLDWQAAEVAEALGQTVPSVKSALHRARTTLANHKLSAQLEAARRHPPDEHLRGQLDRYVLAWETADVDGLLNLLRDDATFSMPPTPSWYLGRANIGGLVSRTIFGGSARGRWRLLPTRANGQTGYGLYKRDEASGSYMAYGIQVVTFAGDAIADITTFRNPALLPRFNLPVTAPAARAWQRNEVAA
jgi:RNA polymerase sigma-70 factor (ECF subfamily)